MAHAEINAVFDYLARNGFAPTWVGGQYVVANVPGVTLGTNGMPNTMHTRPEKVRSMREAVRLVVACS